MKKNMIIYAALTASVAAVVYFLQSKKTATTLERQQLAQPSRHLTDVFSKAKRPNLPMT